MNDLLKISDIENRDCMPRDNCTCVYRLHKDSTVIYVGQTKNLKNRLYSHLSKKVDYDYFSFSLCSDEEVNDIEAYNIIKFNAKLNKSIPSSTKYHSISTYKNEIRKAFSSKVKSMCEEFNIHPDLVFSRDERQFKRGYVTKAQLDDHLNIIKNIKITYTSKGE
tara:strand:+ start:264 stop:755 length:492 start_codon:yes stop_codon:yes gene_type:complete